MAAVEPRVDVRLLGPVEVAVAGVPVPLRSGRQQALVAALALQSNQVVPSDQLVDVLWYERLPEDPRNAMQQLVADLRRRLGRARGRVRTVPGGYLLHLAPDELDVTGAELHLSAARAALGAGVASLARTEALSAGRLWRGPSLTGLDEGPLAARARRLDDLAVRVDLLLAEATLTVGDRDELRETADRMVASCARHPLHEELWVRRIELLWRSGRPAEALAAYDDLRRRLSDELGTDPSTELRELHRALLEGDAAPAPSSARERIDYRASGGHVESPAQLSAAPATRLVGRQHELRLLEDWSRSGAPLATLVGPAGVGKTRLAEELARLVDGPVVFVRLDAISGGSDVTAAVGAALMLREVGTRSMPHVVAEMLPPGALLVLDNAEHVLGGVAEFVTHILSTNRDARVLVTSQWPLGLPGERLLRVDVLATGVSDGPDASDVTPDAAALLLDRAAHSRHSLVSPTDEDIQAAIEIAASLDGLPLAIELAAAQARLLTMPQLCDQLRSSLRLLDRDTASREARHRRLSDAVAWSVGLLSEEQRGALARCAVLGDAFDVLAAAAVMDVAPEDALPLLLDLGDRSVVQIAPAEEGEVRFRLLRAIRVQALRELEREHAADVTRDRLVAYVLALAEEADAALFGSAQLRWLRRLDAARADVEAALTHALAGGNAAEAAGIVAALGRYWDWRGRLRDADRWTAGVLDAVRRNGADRVQRLGAVLAWRAFVVNERGEVDEARRLVNEAVAVALAAGDEDGYLTALGARSLLPGPADAIGRVEALSEMARAAASTGHEWAAAWVVNRRGYVAVEAGRVDEAQGLAGDSLIRFHALGDERGVQWTRLLEALIAQARGQQEEAVRRATGVKEAAERLGDLRTAAAAAELVATVSGDRSERVRHTRFAESARSDRLRP
ncbi:MAG: BTAD domain-containing putative transcriptional regulator [Mycobacteriales bacterium]